MSNNITEKSYNEEIDAIVIDLIDEIKRDSEFTDDLTGRFYELLHETIDGHEWVIYTYRHLQVLQISENAEYGIDELGPEWAAKMVKDGGLSALHMGLTYWAMYADCVGRFDSDALEVAE